MSKGRTFFLVLLVIIVVAVLGLCGYLAYNYINSDITMKEAADAVEQFENLVQVIALEDDEPEQNYVIETPTVEETPQQQTSGITYKSYNVVGTIEIPKTGAKYPIVSDTSAEAMENAVVFLYGPGLNEIGNSIIIGHNYRNGSFFGQNKNLENGDSIYITNLKGQKIEYLVYKKYNTTDDDFTYASRETNGKREISLSTCTANASVRLVIWAKER